MKSSSVDGREFSLIYCGRIALFGVLILLASSSFNSARAVWGCELPSYCSDSYPDTIAVSTYCGEGAENIQCEYTYCRYSPGSYMQCCTATAVCCEYTQNGHNRVVYHNVSS